MESENKEYVLQERYVAFDTIVELVFVGTTDNLSECERRNHEAFVAKQDALTSEIMEAIFEYYKGAYDHYREGFEIFKEMYPDAAVTEEEEQELLPIPTDPERLKSHITPLSIYIPSAKDCVDGTLGIAFSCTWDIKSELGVRIDNWKNIQVGTQHIAFF